jgi:tetratricopeptide (TPR) repeat protein
MYKNFLLFLFGLFILTSCRMKDRAGDFYITATSKAEKGDIQGALVDYDKAIELNPKFAMAYHNRGYYCRLATGNLQGALEDFTKSIEVIDNDNDAYSLSMRSFVKLQMNDVEGALSDVTSSLALDSTNSFAYRNKALVILATGDTAQCITNLQKAKTLGFSSKFGTEVDELLNRLSKAK